MIGYSGVIVRVWLLHPMKKIQCSFYVALTLLIVNTIVCGCFSKRKRIDKRRQAASAQEVSNDNCWDRRRKMNSAMTDPNRIVLKIMSLNGGKILRQRKITPLKKSAGGVGVTDDSFDIVAHFVEAIEIEPA